MFVSPKLRGLRQKDSCEFLARPVYTASTRPEEMYGKTLYKKKALKNNPQGGEGCSCLQDWRDTPWAFVQSPSYKDAPALGWLHMEGKHQHQ